MSDQRTRTIPSKRLSRLGHVGSMTASVVGNMALNGAAQLGQGKRPVMKDLLLTPRNITRVTQELAKMRGAAMKMGQLMSMDTGDLLPPELAQIMAALRDDAYSMPPAQLKQVLNAQWPKGWIKEFQKFDVHPIAAASIGQVHRAQLKDGRDLAIKVQYPGVAKSIDSDVANVGALIKLSGLMPKGFELAPYLAEARAQLHDETDYAREGAALKRFGTLLQATARFVVPQMHSDWSTPQILAMDYVAGIPIEDAANEPEDVRIQITADLIALSLRELFEFGVMQTDPNFANYLYKPDTGQIVLLDFGASRDIDPEIIAHYHDLLRAGLSGDTEGLISAAQNIGFLPAAAQDSHRAQIIKMISRVFETLRDKPVIDFTDQTLSQNLQSDGIALARDGFVPPPLPMDVLLLQRKFAGVFLLGARLKAKLAVRDMVQRYVSPSKSYAKP